ncbi:MAG: recombinase family protein, partial [Acidobacteriota bacterium]
IDFVSYQENIDTTSPLGMAVFTIISAIAQLERDIIAERVRAGMRRAKANGKRVGRPMVEVDLALLSRMVEQGMSLRQMARHLGVSKSSVRRLLRQVSQKGADSRPSETLQYGAS